MKLFTVLVLILSLLVGLFSCQSRNNEQEYYETIKNRQKEHKKDWEKYWVQNIIRLKQEGKLDSAQGFCNFFLKQCPNSEMNDTVKKLYSEITKEEQKSK